jgi:hypothetical protein
MTRRAIGFLPASLRDEVENGFYAVTVRGDCALWTDSQQEARESSSALLGELWGMLRTGRYEEGEADAIAYAVGRDLGLAARRRREGAA